MKFKTKRISFRNALLYLVVLLSTTVSNANSGDTFEASKTDVSIKVPTEAHEIKIMSYNVQNLFDAEHDEGKLDHTWLPTNAPGKNTNCQKQSSDYYRKQCLETNWNAKKIQAKLKQIKKSISLQGTLPDLLAVQEIENDNIASKLAKTLGYDKFLITNSPDKRGIDVALFYNTEKLAYIEHEEIDVSTDIGFATRNILRVHFRPVVGSRQTTLGVYVNHWPSQATKSYMNPARLKAAMILRKNIQKQIDRIGLDNYYAVATGDFNTLTHELPNAFFHGIQDSKWPNYLEDVQFQSERYRNPMTYKMPRGTYWYEVDGKFNRFDHFFVTRNLLWSKNPASPKVDVKSFRIVGTAENSVLHNYEGRDAYHQLPQQWVPKKYEFMTESTKSEDIGFSDHYPVVVKVTFAKDY